MTFRTLVLTCLTLLVFASQAEAQHYAFTNKVTTQEGYALAIAQNDRSLLVVPCITIVAAVRRVHGNALGFIDCRGMATYIRSLEVVDCPKQSLPAVEIVATDFGRDATDTTRHEFEPGEKCLYDRSRQMLFASLSCGSVFGRTPPVTLLSANSEAAPVTVDLRQATHEALKGQVAVKVTGEVGVDGRVGVTYDFERPLTVEHSGQIQIVEAEKPPRTWFERHWKWLVPAALAAGGATYCLTGRDRCRSTNTQIVNVYR